MASLARALSRPRPILSNIIPRATYTTATSDYIPGKRGYAPGFEPPPKPQPKKKPSTDNTEKPLSKSDTTAVTIKTVVAATVPKISENVGLRRRFREEMRQRRFTYVKELLQKQENREIVSERKRANATLKVQTLRDVDARAKEKAIEHERKILLELQILSLFDEAETEVEAETPAEAEIMAEAAKARTETSTETKTATRTATRTEAAMTPELRTQARAAALRDREQAKSDERLSLLMRLYHTAGDFVTYENLETKLTEFIEAPNAQHDSTLEELQADVGYKERKIVKMRMEKLREMLDGKMMGENLAAEGVREWVRNQEKDSIEKTDQEPVNLVKYVDM